MINMTATICFRKAYDTMDSVRLIYILVWCCLGFLCTISCAEPTLTLRDCPEDFVPTPNPFSCMCVAENVSDITFSVLWKDPKGNTITQSHGHENTLSLLFTSVRQEFNTQQYICELLHDGGFKRLPYFPKIAELPSQPYLMNCPEELLFSSDKNASCMCVTSSLGKPPALLTWEDPKGNTIKLTQSETFLILPFTDVKDSFSGKDYRCAVTQPVTKVHNIGIVYKPQVIVRPNDPVVFGVRESYAANSNIEMTCRVWGGIPDVIKVDLHCTNHEDQPDEWDSDGKLASSLSFVAKFSDNNTQCVCQGLSQLTNSKEEAFSLRVKIEDEHGVEEKLVVPIVVSLIGAIAAVVAAIIGVRCYRKKTSA